MTHWCCLEAPRDLVAIGRCRAGSRPRHGEHGSATAELAVALPSLVLVLVVALGAVDLGLSEVRCVDAARLGARLLARGEVPASVLGQVRAAAPGGARVTMTTTGTSVSVVVTGRLPTALQRLPALSPPSATAQALLEQAP